MSDNQIQKLLERIALMEQRLADATAKPAPQAPPSPAIDWADPDSLIKAGADLDYLTKVLVARAMGDQAPDHLRVVAQMGPQISATRRLEQKLEDLANKVTGIVDSSAKKSARESFKTLAADKTKYPALSKVLTADPDFFNEDLEGLSGSAEDFATKMEARLAKLPGFVATETASDEDADTTGDEEVYDSNLANELGFDPNDDSIVANGQSEQPDVGTVEAPKTVPPPPKRAPVNGRMPPLNQPKAGVFTPDENAKLIEEVVRKYSGRQS